MAFLIDTNIISELRKKDRCDQNVAAWQLAVSNEEVFISTITMMEIRLGIFNAKRTNTFFAAQLETWYETQVKPTFVGRVLSVDLDISEYCSMLLNERTRNLADALIAATAYVHHLTLATRNVADFNDCGLKLVNPWQPMTT